MGIPLVYKTPSKVAYISSGDPTVTPGVGGILARLDPTPSEVERKTWLRYDISRAYSEDVANEVVDFLLSHPSLVDIVVEAGQRLRELFGPVAGLRLEIHHDPETDGVELFALVETHLSPDEALDRLREFDESWFLHQQDVVKGMFNVDIIFR